MTKSALNCLATLGLAAKVAILLVETLYHPGRNITADSYFTDFAVVAKLLLKKLHVFILFEKTSLTFLQNSKLTKLVHLH